jgi:serine/threonine-protein kinase RsbW
VAELRVEANLEELSAIGAFVLKAAEEAGLDRRVAYRLRLAVDELATNVIMHGKPATSSGAGEIRFLAEIAPETLTIVMEDQGPAFDPLEHQVPEEHLNKPIEERPIGGLGVFLAIRGVDGFQYERVGDRNRSIFTARRQARSLA